MIIDPIVKKISVHGAKPFYFLVVIIYFFGSENHFTCAC